MTTLSGITFKEVHVDYTKWNNFQRGEATDGVGPIFWMKDIMDQHRYLNIIQTVMLPHAEWEMPLKCQFMHDNGPKHTAKAVKKWFVYHNIDVMNWPAQSPAFHGA